VEGTAPGFLDVVEGDLELRSDFSLLFLLSLEEGTAPGVFVDWARDRLLRSFALESLSCFGLREDRPRGEEGGKFCSSEDDIAEDLECQ